jgi:hypothetical protein
LEEEHGRRLVHATLSLLALARAGLSESELLHLLALDDDVSPSSVWCSVLYRALQRRMFPIVINPLMMSNLLMVYDSRILNHKKHSFPTSLPCAPRRCIW